MKYYVGYGAIAFVFLVLIFTHGIPIDIVVYKYGNQDVVIDGKTIYCSIRIINLIYMLVGVILRQ